MRIVQNLDFSDISIAGRFAYANCCIEEYLTEQGESLEKWSIILDWLWSFSEQQDARGYWYDLANRFPDAILESDTYQPVNWLGQKDVGTDVSESEWNALRKLYTSSQSTQFINQVMDRMIAICGVNLDGLTEKADLLHITEKDLIPLFTKNLKMLPDIEAFRIFSISRDVWDRFHTRDEIRLKFLENPDFQRK